MANWLHRFSITKRKREARSKSVVKSGERKTVSETDESIRETVETTPAVESVSRQIRPEVVTESRESVHVGIRFSLNIELQSKEPPKR